MDNSIAFPRYSLIVNSSNFSPETFINSSNTLWASSAFFESTFMSHVTFIFAPIGPGEFFNSWLEEYK